MCTFVPFRGGGWKSWIPALLICLSAASLQADPVVIGPALATRPEIPEGELLISELNCVACHSAPGDDLLHSSRKSPLLGKNGQRITPQYLRAFLNDPLQYKPGTTMPDTLHHLSGKNRNEAVEALVHFLVSEQDGTPEQGVGAEDFQVKQGRVLYHTIGCVACHEPQAAPHAIPGITPEDPKLAEYDPALRVPASVPLGDLARKTTVEQLAKFLLDPLKVRPSGRMPSFNLTPGDATSLAVYLLRAQTEKAPPARKESLIAGLKYQYFEENFTGNTDFESLTPKATGNISTFDVSPRKRDGSFGFRFSGSITIPTNGTYTFYSRSDDGSMLYIDGKVVVNNGGEHAPQEKRGNIDLTAGDHSIVVTFYNAGGGYEFEVQWRGPGIKRQTIPASVLSHVGRPMVPLDSAEFSVDRALADKGRQLFASMNCASCHTTSEPLVSAKNAKPLAALAGSDEGCLSKDPGEGVPKFGFSEAQRSAIQQALSARNNIAITPGARVTETLARMNCYACHTRDGKGGPVDARLAYFRTVGELDMGDEGRIPPHLTQVGAKLRPEWMHEVLVNHGRVRPYMATRMPQFGAENIGFLPGALEKADVRKEEKQAPETTQRAAKFGRKLAGTGGLSCISCHTVAGHKSLGIPAIDLTTMSTRLRYDWFYRYLINPPSLRPGTRMPSFWPNGEAVNKDILGGNTEAQVNAIWAYLSSNPETDLPDGLIQGRMELVADKEPIIYRNFIQGAGSRAIAVGYPEKVNLAFDANEIRLAMIWQGPFIDAARHRSGRGEGFEPPLGNNILNMPAGPEFAVLESQNESWPANGGKRAGFKMGGYSLDHERRPTFFYTFHGLRIEEKMLPTPGEVDAYFQRSFTITGPPVPDLFFRAAVGEIETRNDSYVVDGRTILKFPGSKPLLRKSGTAQELLVPVTFSGTTAQITEDIIW